MYVRKTVITIIFTKLTISRYSDSLRARRSRDRNAVGARFFAPVQTGCKATGK